MGILGDATLVDSRTGRKVSNALTLTYRTPDGETLATAVQAGGLGTLLGFKNGGKGRYVLQANQQSLNIDCAFEGTRVTRETGAAVGVIGPDGSGGGTLTDPNDRLLARITPQPLADKAAATWSHPVVSAEGQALGVLTLLRTTTRFNLVDEAWEAAIWHNRAGQPLKVPTLGAHLALDAPVDETLGDLLLACCVDITCGSHGFLAHAE